MEKRSLLAVALSALVLVLYYTFFFEAPKPLSSSAPAPVAKTETLPLANSPSLESSSVPELPKDFKATDIKINNTLYEVSQTSLGGRVLSFLTKAFHETPDPKSPFVDLFKGSPSENFVLRFRESNLVLPTLIPFTVNAQGKDFIEYLYTSPEIKLIQRVEWNDQNYVAQVKVSLQNTSEKTLQTSLGLRLESAQNVQSKQGWGFLKPAENFKYPVQLSENKVERFQNVKKLAANNEKKSAFQWVGFEDRYFLWAIISRALSGDQVHEYGTTSADHIFSELYYPKEVIAPQTSLQKEFTVYVGPKQIDHLKALNVGLDRSVDYGWFSFVAHPILFLLKFFYGLVKNWGLAIILLTLFIKLLLHPINKKSLESMKAMQQIQPKLAELREKYKNDKERMNVEMMNLFKANKVNPAGGCLPMLLQMPVYIALYKVLYNAIELYHAPFFGFYKDLSAPDPYFISPILLGVFMVLQQKMTPSTQDPDQAKIMMIMPLMFSLFMLFLPSGLVIYIFVNTFITVVQQYLHQHNLSLMDLFKRMKKA